MKLKVIFYPAIGLNTSSLKSVIQSWTSGLYFRTHTTLLVERVKQHMHNGVTLMDFYGVTKKYQTHG